MKYNTWKNKKVSISKTNAEWRELIMFLREAWALHIKDEAFGMMLAKELEILEKELIK